MVVTILGLQVWWKNTKNRFTHSLGGKSMISTSLKRLRRTHSSHVLKQLKPIKNWRNLQNPSTDDTLCKERDCPRIYGERSTDLDQFSGWSIKKWQTVRYAKCLCVLADFVRNAWKQMSLDMDPV